VDGWPQVVELTGRHGVVSDGHKSADKGGKGSDTEEGEGKRVGNHSNKEAWKVGASKNTYANHKGWGHGGQIGLHTSNGD